MKQRTEFIDSKKKIFSVFILYLFYYLNRCVCACFLFILAQRGLNTVYNSEYPS